MKECTAPNARREPVENKLEIRGSKALTVVNFEGTDQLFPKSPWCFDIGHKSTTYTNWRGVSLILPLGSLPVKFMILAGAKF